MKVLVAAQNVVDASGICFSCRHNGVARDACTRPTHLKAADSPGPAMTSACLCTSCWSFSGVLAPLRCAVSCSGPICGLDKKKSDAALALLLLRCCVGLLCAAAGLVVLRLFEGLGEPLVRDLKLWKGFSCFPSSLWPSARLHQLLSAIFW